MYFNTSLIIGATRGGLWRLSPPKLLVALSKKKKNILPLV